MTRTTFGIVCGIVYGLLSAGTMIPLQFPDKRAAILGAFPIIGLGVVGGLIIGVLSARYGTAGA